MTVIDIGFEKVDVTAVHDGRVVNHIDLGAENIERQISGGEVFTKPVAGSIKNDLSFPSIFTFSATGVSFRDLNPCNRAIALSKRAFSIDSIFSPSYPI
jgi:hypothetical protein